MASTGILSTPQITASNNFAANTFAFPYTRGTIERTVIDALVVGETHEQCKRFVKEMENEGEFDANFANRALIVFVETASKDSLEKLHGVRVEDSCIFYCGTWERGKYSSEAAQALHMLVAGSV